MLTANKGEWSELYVLLKTLGSKRLYAGDSELNQLPISYPIVKALREDRCQSGELSKLEFLVDGENICISENGIEFIQVPCKEFTDTASQLFDAIKAGPSKEFKGAFPIPVVSTFLEKIRCRTIKAKSSDKADIRLVTHDHRTCTDSLFGFSIKSEAGNKSSLLNPSKSTNMHYVLSGNITDSLVEEVNAISSKEKVVDRVKRLIQSGVVFTFRGFGSSVFESNLRMIDTMMPEIIGHMVLDCYIHSKDISLALERLTTANPLHFDQSMCHDFYGYKIKAVLIATALGMHPATVWSGSYDATGGYIIVKENGDVICFHTYDRNMLEQYLVSNTKFDTPTSDPKKIGGTRYLVYKEDNNWCFNLNLQIRFK